MDRFVEVKLYEKKVDLADVTHSLRTEHVKKDRKRRMKQCFELNRFEDGTMAVPDRTFEVLCGDGSCKLYVVTRRAVLFVFDKAKFEAGWPSMITAYPAKLPKLAYLYKSCGLKIPRPIARAAAGHT